MIMDCANGSLHDMEESIVKPTVVANDKLPEDRRADLPYIRRNAVITRSKEALQKFDPNEDRKSSAANETTAVGDDILRSISVEKIRDLMQQMESDVMEQVGNQIKLIMSGVLQQLEEMQPGKQTDDLFQETTKYSNRQKSLKDGSLPEKKFLMRNSLLTDLFKIKHIKTIYHIFIVILIILFINTAVYDIVDTGSTNFGISTIMMAFGKFNKVLWIWCGMLASTFGVYVAFSVWAHQRIHIAPKSIQLKIWDYSWLIALIVYQILFIIFPANSLLTEDLPPASSVAVLMEQVRLVMKTHAFVRSAAPRTLNYKPHTEQTIASTCPGFTKFLYYLFCPTLIYRDDYPRTKVIRWRVVVWSYTEVILVVFYMAFIFERLLIPVFRQFGASPLEPRALVLSVFGTMMPGTLAFLCGFYCLLHSWMNASAELLRFADRMFYKDWWNSTSYDAYYRTWNVVVHDWLYTYIYKDIYEIIAPRNKMLSTFMVFSVSAIFHEYILAFAFRFFYPVLLVMFGGIGLILVFLTRKNEQAGGNVFMWLTLCMGTGMILSLYSMEYYARINCPPYKDEFLDLFIPRSWTCHRLSNS
ncbi:sterol O-acyltransferase 1 isoform X1 [Neodiprion fabricii]|uniref:sterol O-acyltransferase 1 isoform X1 n=1 Tax=Neodiprion fabricii TaxID=2872261 RepID=UPI001ED8CE02|nr:sterol O-acyltransferase 1 isoform X1 [Neodiprion fabricii]